MYVYLMTAHATTTHRGMGANTAIRDAVELAKCFTTSSKSSNNDNDDDSKLEKALNEWQKVMVARGVDVVKLSKSSTEMIHSTGWWTVNVIRPLLLRFVSVIASWGQPRELK